MDFDYLIKKRKSVRAFSSKKVDWKLIYYAIDATRHCPLSGNKNNLKFMIIEVPETILKIARLSDQLWMNEAPFLIVVCSDDTHLENQYGDRGRVYSRQQAGAAIQTLLLKLTDLSLSSCWVGAYSDEQIKQLLKIPQHVQIEAIIPIGHEDRSLHAPKKRKKKLENIVFCETWQNYKRAPFIKDPATKFELNN